MRLWPFGRKAAPDGSERRQGGYTDTITSQFVAAAFGDGAMSPLGLSALETAAGLWSRGFAAAEVTGDRGALDPITLSHMARELCRSGNSMWWIRVGDAGDVRLLPVGDWDPHGPYDPELVSYRISIYGASDNVVRWVPNDGVIHAKYAFDSTRPYYGVSPMAYAHSSGTLAGYLERRLGEEASAAVGHLLPVPDRHGAEGPDDDGTDPLAAFKSDLGSAKGRTLLVESTAAGWGDGRAAAPQAEWTPKRFGGAPPAPNVALRQAASEAVLNACGVPVALTGHGEASGLREAWRVFLHGTLAPLARLIETEASRKLDSEVRINFDGLMASDLQGRARAYKSLVDGGMPGPDAATLCGFERSRDG